MNGLLYAFYQNTAGQGVVGLSGTVDVYQVLKASPFTSTLFVASGTMVQVGSGLYLIGLTGTDPTLYDYPAAFKVTGSVSSQWQPALRWDAAEAWASQLANADVKVSSRLPSGTVDLSASSRAAVVDEVWDEILTGATHNVSNSAGKRLRQITSNIIYEGTVVSTTENVVVLDNGASSTDGAYDPGLIVITSGVGLGQCREILQYTGASRSATIDRDWKTQPQAGDGYILMAWPGREHVNEGLAQGGTINTITLNANASAQNDTYVGQVVFIRSGTGEDQACRVIAYNGTTKVATMAKNWNVIPDTTSGYVMLPTAVLDVINLISSMSAAVWDYQTTAMTTPGSAGALLVVMGIALANVAQSVWQYGTRTLTSFGTLIADIWSYVTRTLTSGGGGGGATAQEVWEYVSRTLTQTAPQIAQQFVDNSQVNVYKSTTFVFTLNNLPDFTDWQKLWFTVKEESSLELPDTESILQLVITAPTGTVNDGLLYVNKEPATLTDGYLVVNSTTSVTVKVKPSVTGNLPPKKLYYGMKYLNGIGDTIPIADLGEFVIHHSTSKKVS